MHTGCGLPATGIGIAGGEIDMHHAGFLPLHQPQVFTDHPEARPG